MTDNEAKSVLFDMLGKGIYVKDTKENQAILVALRALERDPCENAISRQAVRHILNHEVKMPIKVWKKLFELVDCLPPVTPQTECEECLSVIFPECRYCTHHTLRCMHDDHACEKCVRYDPIALPSGYQQKEE